MYLFTTLGYAHRDVWEQKNDHSSARFSSRYEKIMIDKIKNEISLGKNLFAVGHYYPYYGRNSSQQGEPAQYQHSSLLLLQGIEYNNHPRYDIKILFRLIKKISPDDTKKIINLKPKSTPLISFVDDKIFLNSSGLPPDFFMTE